MKTNDSMVALVEDTDVMLAEVGEGSTIQIYRDASNLYHVVRDGMLRHPNCSAEAAMAALANYLHSAMCEASKYKDILEAQARYS